MYSNQLTGINKTAKTSCRQQIMQSKQSKLKKIKCNKLQR